MTTYYVRSDGLAENDGLTWTTAKPTLTAALSAATAGDTIYVDKAVLNSAATATTYTSTGTAGNPIKVVSVNSTNNPQPPTLAESGAVMEVTGTNTVSMSGSVYFSGVTLRVGSGSGGPALVINNTDGHVQMYEDCTLAVAATGGSAIQMGISSTGVEGQIDLKNVKLSFGATAQSMRVYQRFRWNGGELASGTAAITNLIASGSMGLDAVISGVDLSRGAGNMNIVGPSFQQFGQVMIRSCKLPTGWTGKLAATSPLAGVRISMHNCSAGSTLYPLWEETMFGKVLHDTAYVKTGGANDGSSFSWKVETTSTASYPTASFDSPSLPAKWISTVGSPITVAVDVLTDSATPLTNSDIWIELQYAAGTDTKTSFASSVKASFVAPSASLPSSTATWNTSGMSNPQARRLSVTFTPQRAGFIQGRVFVAKPTSTVYIDPKFIVS